MRIADAHADLSLCWAHMSKDKFLVAARLLVCLKLLKELQTVITKTRLFKYIENFTTKNWKFSDKNSDIFSYFCSKHTSNEYPQSTFLSRIKKNNVNPL